MNRILFGEFTGPTTPPPPGYWCIQHGLQNEYLTSFTQTDANDWPVSSSVQITDPPNYRTVQVDYVRDEPPRYFDVISKMATTSTTTIIHNPNNNNNQTTTTTTSSKQYNILKKCCCCRNSLKSYICKVAVLFMLILGFILMMSRINCEW
uniref:Uncharacterized protein n=1 Tax=Clytia hemisphaerica TaxID=252671 RepID=A0A7M5XCX7_9CNID|eukprot:TCONS_00019659-protein